MRFRNFSFDSSPCPCHGPRFGELIDSFSTQRTIIYISAFLLVILSCPLIILLPSFDPKQASRFGEFSNSLLLHSIGENSTYIPAIEGLNKINQGSLPPSLGFSSYHQKNGERPKKMLVFSPGHGTEDYGKDEKMDLTQSKTNIFSLV